MSGKWKPGLSSTRDYSLPSLALSFLYVGLRGVARLLTGRVTLVERECATHFLRTFGQTLTPTMLLTFSYGLVTGLIWIRSTGGTESFLSFGFGWMGNLLISVVVPFAIANFVIIRGIVSLTSDIVSMRVTQEIDLLETLPAHPLDLVFAPRAWGLVLAAPVLALAGFYMAFLGMWLGTAFEVTTTLEMAMLGYLDGITQRAFVLLLLKMVLIAWLMATGAAYQAFKQSSSNTMSIGVMTTKAVAYSMIFITIVNMGMSLLFQES